MIEGSECAGSVAMDPDFLPVILIDLKTQRLIFKKGEESESVFPISSAVAGIGMEPGSHKTPVGRFRIARKIGDGAPAGTVFRGRVPVGQWSGDNSGAFLDDNDLITSRILWLAGLDEANANTFDRYIYIHGTNHEDKLGTPCSHGCVRMSNDDVIRLFDMTDEGDPVVISDSLVSSFPQFAATVV